MSMPLAKEETEKVVKKYGKNEKDTGATEVQIALLTQRIIQLTDHFKENKKDHNSRRGLMKLVGQRRRLLKYLQREDQERYKKVLKSLKLRK
jgi:small subunit ribosomal protein S15